MALPEANSVLQPARGLAGPWAQWREPLLLILLLTAGIIAAYYPTFVHITTIWYDTSSFNHCFLIIPISAYVIWERRAAFIGLGPRPSWLGVALAAAAALIWMMGEFVHVAFAQHVGLVLAFMGAILAVAGWRAVHAGLFPWCYLLLLVPFGEFLGPILQDVTAVQVVQMLKILQVPVYSDGLFFMLPVGNFEVAAECSGFKYLTAMFALGLLYANLMYRAWWRRGIYMVLTIVVPILTNGVRAFGIMYISYLSNNEIDIAHNHLTYGKVVFGASMLALMWFGQSFSDIVKGEADIPVNGVAPPPSPPLRQWLPLVFALLAVTWAAPAYTRLTVPAARVADHPAPMAAPSVTGWTATGGLDMDKPLFRGADRDLWTDYVKNDQAVKLYAAFYDTVRQGAEPVNYDNLLFTHERWTRLATAPHQARIGGQSRSVQMIRIKGASTDRMMWTWYWIDGHVTTQDWMVKLYIARARLLGHAPAAGVVVVMTDYVENPDRAIARLADFVAALPPLDKIARAPRSSGQQE